MKLDRNVNINGMGKYALILMRPFRTQPDEVSGNTIAPRAAIMLLDSVKMLDMGDKPDTEFFVIRLKDKFAGPALLAYSMAAREAGDTEWADEVFRLAEKAANHPNKQQPT